MSSVDKVGIVSYGAYVPRFRIKVEEIARVWGVSPNVIRAGLNIETKSVPAPDEDVITISVEASRIALERCQPKLNPKDIGAIYVGSESHPYAVKPTATVVSEAIGAVPQLLAADYEFACKAGTAAIQTCMGLVRARYIKYGLAIGSDTSQAAPGDALEYTASGGGAAFIIGGGYGSSSSSAVDTATTTAADDDNIIAVIEHTVSYTTDTPDFWRRDYVRYPSHGERFTGVPAYFKHIVNCGKQLFERAGTTPKDYTYAVFHQPNGKFPLQVASRLGFDKEQVLTGLLCPKIGNTYSGATLIGLCAILDKASAGDRIFVVSYGSGAGADGFDIIVTDKIEKFNRGREYLVETMINNSVDIDYALYAKYREKIVMG